MRRGVGALRWTGDGLERCQVWVERTDRAEVQLRVEDAGGDVDVYLTLEEVEVVVGLMRSARNERKLR